MTLHEAIIYVLEGYGSAMSSAEIAKKYLTRNYICNRQVLWLQPNR